MNNKDIKKKEKKKKDKKENGQKFNQQDNWFQRALKKEY